MSQENVEIVGRFFTAWARDDVDAAFALIAPDVQWTTAADEPDSQTYEGHQGLGRLLASVRGIWEEIVAPVPSEFIDLGDIVVVPTTFHARGRVSGVDIASEETYAFTVREGKVARVQEYRTKDEALEAVGLRE